jgi:MYXO-CTERM domain-containing protein
MLVMAALVLAGCGAPVEEEEIAVSAMPLTVGGCTCPTSGSCSALSYSDIPADNTYYVTTFGGGSDTQGMACGGTADGTWAYVADSARFGCGTKLIISAGGKQCVAQVADCGPNRCVEDAASYSGCTSHFPIIDASPLITKYLLGMSGVGWSDKQAVTAVVAPASATLGCPGVVPTPTADSGPPPPPDTGPPPAPDTGPPPVPDTGSTPAPDAGFSPGDQAILPPGPDANGVLPPPTGSGAASAGDLEGGCAVAGPGAPVGSALLVLALLALWLLRPRRDDLA